MSSKKPEEANKKEQLRIEKEAENFDLNKMRADKKNPVKDVAHKFKYSFQGFSYCFKNETSFTFEALALVGSIICGLLAQITAAQWTFSLISLFLITEIELLNTAIEAVVDMVTEKYHPLAKIAKDCGSAATCMATIIAVIVHAYIYIPILLDLLNII